jgi:hypothetical protein
MGDGVIDPVANAHIHPKLPHAIAAKLVIAKIAKFKSVHSAIYGNAGLDITQLQPPVEIRVFTVVSRIVAKFIHAKYSFINEWMSSGFEIGFHEWVIASVWLSRWVI